MAKKSAKKVASKKAPVKAKKATAKKVAKSTSTSSASFEEIKKSIEVLCMQGQKQPVPHEVEAIIKENHPDVSVSWVIEGAQGAVKISQGKNFARIPNEGFFPLLQR